MNAAPQILPPAILGKPGLAVPNSLLRSALFSAAGGKRELLQRVRVASLSNVEITYTGARLGQADLDIWHGLLGLPMGEDGWCEFAGRAFLEKIGRSHGKGDREWLEIGVARLSATTVEVRCEPAGKVYGGSLVDEFVRVEEKDGWWRIKLNLRLANLFAAASWTIIDQSVRAQLARKPLAQWLHAFYATHRNPIPYSARKLMELSGAGKGELWRFRDLLRPALEEIENLTGWGCVLDKATDVVTVKKSTSGEREKEKEDGDFDDPDFLFPGDPQADLDEGEGEDGQVEKGHHKAASPKSENRIEEDRFGIAYKPGNTRDARLLSEIYEDFSEECIAEVVEFLRCDPYGGEQYYEDSTLRKIKGVPWNRGYVWPTAVLDELWKRAMPSAEEMREIKKKTQQQCAEEMRSRLAAAAAGAGIQMRSDDDHLC